ncbi:ead/Ea22-like family protein [Citrobacter freundii]|uniref:ead/Ea22-like family protein n=1 Tax=Citrobacter freundii TaxID=546 RepID=UPI00397DF4FC
MTVLNKHRELRKELSNPAIGSNHHLRKLALSLLDELETKEEQRANWFQMAQKLGEDLDAAEKRIAELETRTITVKFEPIPMEELGNRRDGKKHPYSYNSAVVHCESVLHQACAAAGIGVKGE